MQQNDQRSDGFPAESEFSNYLRTGRRFRPIELKFNPYHDPYSGRFTFGPGGSPGGNNSGSRNRNGTVGSRSFPSMDARNARNYSVHIVRAGDSLEKIARLRKGVTVADLRWLNDLKGDVPLRSGQESEYSQKEEARAGRDAKNRFLALDYYVQTHRGSLPPDVAHPPSIADQIGDPATWEHIEKNGYVFDRDAILRTRRVTGTITANASQGRSRTSQSRAGGADRLPGDHGGHYVARRFDGPTEAFNHFAQDGNFNRGGYRALENEWERDRKAGKKVDIRITPSYLGLSQRPSAIEVFYTIDGGEFTKAFPNRKGGK